MKECKYCGSKYGENEQECPNCGGKLIVSEQERLVEEKIKQTDFQLKQTELDTRAEGNRSDNHKIKKNMLIAVGGLVTIILLVVIINIFVGRDSAPNGNKTNGKSEQEDQIEVEYRAALESLENEEYEEAMDAFAAIPDTYDQYDEVIEAKEKAVNGYVTEVTEKIDEYVKNSKFAEALALLNVAIGKVGDNQELSEKKEEIQELCEEHYFAEAQEYADAGNYEVAIKRLESYEENFGENAEVDAKKLEYRKVIITEKVQEYMQSENYAGGITYLRAQLSSVGNDAQLEAKYDELCSLYKKECLEEAKEYEKKQEYSDAIEVLDAFVNAVGNDSEIDDKILEYKKARIEMELEKYEKNADYEGAISYLKSRLSEVNNDEDLTNRLDGYKKNYRSTLFSNAEEAYQMKGYSSAIAVLNGASEILGYDSEVSEKITYYSEKKPVYLSSIEPYQGELFYHLETVTDVLGDSYSGYYCNTTESGAHFKSRSAVYLLNKQYLHFECKIVPVKIIGDYEREIILQDDETEEILYRAKLGNRDVEGINVSVDVSQVKFLRITLNNEFWAEKFVMVEAQLIK